MTLDDWDEMRAAVAEDMREDVLLGQCGQAFPKLTWKGDGGEGHTATGEGDGLRVVVTGRVVCVTPADGDEEEFEGDDVAEALEQARAWVGARTR